MSVTRVSNAEGGRWFTSHVGVDVEEESSGAEEDVASFVSE